MKIRHIIQMADDVKCEVFAFRHTQTIRNVYYTSHYITHGVYTCMYVVGLYIPLVSCVWT